MNSKALLLIDVQKGFENPSWGKRNNEHAEKNMLKLLHQWRKNKLPVFHVQHASSNENSVLYPKNEGFPFKDGFTPIEGEKHIIKSVNSAFIGTELEKKLKKIGCTDLYVVGLTTQHCVSTTTRMGANLGFHMHVIHDATAAYELTSYDGKYYSAEEVHQAALAQLHDEFAEIISTQQVMDELVKTKTYLN